MNKLSREPFQFTSKDVLVVGASTVLAVGSLASGDPLVVVLMLALATLALVVLCIFHEGSKSLRFLLALSGFLIITLVGWRALRVAPEKSITFPARQPTVQQNVIQQSAHDNDCANLAAGGNITSNCNPAGGNRAKSK